ncbi:MAG: ribonuclease P protein component [Piscinibacter sp.]|nr:ribonuclease P protein component [Piscinibacter sp.]
MFGRLVRPVDFERVLRSPPWARSAHFALHHLAGRPTPPAGRRSPAPGADELSTGHAPVASPLVDDSPQPGAQPDHWLGLVVPKRHARRSVTRTLLKRQIRGAMAAGEAQLPAGLWVVRLRAPFDPAAFPSAASDALRRTARQELAVLLSRPASAARR